MDSASYNDHGVCHTIRLLVAEAFRPNVTCQRSCLDDIAAQQCRDHPNWAPFIEKFCADTRAFLESITSVSDVAAQSEDEQRRRGVLASSGRPKCPAGGFRRGTESWTVITFHTDTTSPHRPHRSVERGHRESNDATRENQQSLVPGIETVPQFPDEESGVQQIEIGATLELEPVGQGPPEQEQVVPETDSENIEREKQAEDFGEMQEADDNIQNSNDDHNVRGDTQGEEEHHDKEEGKKSKRDREDLLAKNSKIPERLSTTSGITLKYVARSSKRRSTRTALLETPTKKSRLADSTATTPSQSAVTVTPESSNHRPTIPTGRTGT
ncbi:hypothetical protein LTR93_011127 [Exophiala xenobiotica]|nr:hypothetical protein LTR93_011127 [Exophiala xenobiotica]